ncbi:MAG: phosphorylase family protein [Microthrixaceae bacterium]
MSPIAFICAMPMELKPLVKRLQLRRTNVGGVDVRAGSLGDREVVAIVTGMGTDLATRGTQQLLDAVTPERVVVVGITGAVESETPIGALILPEVVVNSETGSEHRPHHLGEGTPRGTLWTTNVITPAHELPALRARGVVALDMETAAIAACCEALGIPWSVFRVISDRASDGSVVEEVFAMSNQDGTPNPRAVLRYVLRHPHHVPRLASLAKGARLATERAADAAIAAVSAS